MASLPNDDVDGQSEHLLPRPPQISLSSNVGRISPCRQSIPWTWTIVIILRQLVVLAIAWVFFVLVYHYGPVPLPDKLATRTAIHPRSVTLVVTLVATALSLISGLYVPFVTPIFLCSNIPCLLSSLFKRAMRYAITARLSRPISLFSLSNAVELSRGLVVWSFRHAQWTIISLICVTAISTMTAG